MENKWNAQIYSDLFLGTAKEHEEFNYILSNALKEIKEQNNIRYIVLETWLVVDFFVRDAIGKAFRFNNFSTESHDWRIELLPNSFNSCLNIFQNLLESQRSLPKDPYKPKIKLPAGFWIHIKKDKDFFKKFKEMERSYYELHHPKIIEQEKIAEEKLLTGILESIEEIYNEIQYQIDEQWCEVYECVNKNWFSEVKSLNNARNLAAHSYNLNDIYRKLGFSGNNSFELAKEFCLDIIYTLLQVNTLNE